MTSGLWLPLWCRYNKSSQWQPNRPFANISESLVKLTVPRLGTWRKSQGSHSSETWTQYVVQPTQCINILLNWYGKPFRIKSGKLFRGRDLILMKLKPHVSQAGALLTPPFECFVHQRAKNCPSMTKISRVKTHYLSKNTTSKASKCFLRPWMQINDFDLFLAVR